MEDEEDSNPTTQEAVSLLLLYNQIHMQILLNYTSLALLGTEGAMY